MNFLVNGDVVKPDSQQEEEGRTVAVLSLMVESQHSLEVACTAENSRTQSPLLSDSQTVHTKSKSCTQCLYTVSVHTTQCLYTVSADFPV